MKINNKKHNGFLAKSIYESGIIKEDDFWYVVKGLLDWNHLSEELKELFKNELTGATNYSPELMLKILFIQRMYAASDRAVSEMCSQTIKLKYFLGLEIQEKAPDYSTISKFRSNIINKFGESYFKGLFDGILATIKSLGVDIGKEYVIDSSITYSDVNTFKDKKRIEEGKTPRDTDASWTAKTRSVQGDDITASRRIYYHGYKTHILSDLDSDIITSIIPTTAKKWDGSMTDCLVKENISKGYEINTLTGDRAYGQDRVMLSILEKDYGVNTAMHLKKEALNEGELESQLYWMDYAKNSYKKEILSKRGRIEKIFADMKNNHGLRRSAYIGLMKFSMQSYLSAICHNLKRAMKILYGIKLNIG